MCHVELNFMAFGDVWKSLILTKGGEGLGGGGGGVKKSTTVDYSDSCGLMIAT